MASRRGPLAGVQGHRTRWHRTGTARGDGARRLGCRRGAGSPSRRADDAGRGSRPAAPRKADRRSGRQDAAAALLELAAKADVLLDCFRPGTCERLGIGPDDCAAVNPRLIFARITGWGQDGPLAPTAGHDINYLSQTGALSALGYRDRPPMPPLNLVADFGGGSMLVLLGIVAALYERERSGKGQVVDAAMVDGVSVLAQMMWTMKSTGALRDQRESFLLDGGAPFYRCYETSDGKYMAVGAIEPQFFAAVAGRTRAVAPRRCPASSTSVHTHRCTRCSPSGSPAGPATSGHEVFAGTDACVTPVLTWSEAADRRPFDRAVDGDHRPRGRAGRACAAVFPNTGRAGRAAAGGNHTA